MTGKMNGKIYQPPKRTISCNRISTVDSILLRTPIPWANNQEARALLLYAMHRNNSTMTEAELDAMLHRADTTDTHGMTPEEIHAALAPP